MRKNDVGRLVYGFFKKTMTSKLLLFMFTFMLKLNSFFFSC